MYKVIIGVGAVFAVILFVVAILWIYSVQAPPGVVPSFSGALPGGGTGGASATSASATASSTATTSAMTIAGTLGPLTVLDFLHNGETGADPANTGMYYLAGSPGYCLANGSCPGGASTTAFNITYSADKQLFTVILLTEPLGQVRLTAQQFLESRLGLSDAQLCTIKYYLGTISAVNQFYAGTNLGFSFCPGATPLP